LDHRRKPFLSKKHYFSRTFMTTTQDIVTSNFKVELRNIEDVKPYERNPRLNDKAVNAVAASLSEFGFRQPIVVDEDGVIIAGHTRWKAATKLGLAKVPVHVATDLSPEQVRAYRLADNRTGEIAEWDLSILPIELNELREGGFDMNILAFDEVELGKLISEAQGIQEGLTDPDSIPEPPDAATTKRGDIWILGNHRLMCGDSSSEEDLDKLLNGATIDLLNMDPPYNVRLEPRSNNAIAAGKSSFKPTHHQQMDAARRKGDIKPTQKKLRPKDRPLANDFVTEEEFDRLLLAWFSNASRVMRPGASGYVWGGYANLANYPAPLKAAGLYFSQCIVWNKLHPVLTRKDYLNSYEICFYAWKEGAGHRYYGPTNACDIWDIKKVPASSTVHLTEKPVELAVRAIQYSSKPGQNVLDLFGGSGSTLIGCEQTGRHAFLMELDELYVDVIVKRWEEFTGEKAQRIPAQQTPESKA
jgi:DNA modification methylase